MFTKDNVKSISLITITCLLIGAIIIFSALGILTNAPNSINHRKQTDAAIDEIQSKLFEIEMKINNINSTHSKQSDTLARIESELSELTENLMDQIEIKDGPALYADYADEITETIYPNIPGEYVKAIIWRESRYEPEAINKKTNMIGLMQISAKWHTKRAESLGVTDLTDPYGNILVGCDILNDVMQNHDLEYALNFFAGGYDYANQYKNSTSPVIKQLNTIIDQMNTGVIILEGTTSIS